MLRQATHCIRYKNIEISNYVNLNDSIVSEQFSALTVSIPDIKNYVTFRSTDDTLVAWKENCKMAVSLSVPSQKDATLYLEKAAENLKSPFTVLGYSKG